jgi:hypothetical protein
MRQEVDLPIFDGIPFFQRLIAHREADGSAKKHSANVSFTARGVTSRLN